VLMRTVEHHIVLPYSYWGCFDEYLIDKCLDKGWINRG
jgi:hypothetical protein